MGARHAIKLLPLLTLQLAMGFTVSAFSDVTVQLVAPRFVLHRESATLRCEHNLAPENVYKVDYLKHGVKIFQYIRERVPPYLNYTLAGAYINISSATPKSVVLSDLDFEASGLYSCEIVLEVPITVITSKEHEITVIHKQKVSPKIKLKRTTFWSNSSLEAECHSGYARPAPHLTWMINGKKVDESHIHPHGTFHRHHHGVRLASTRSSLEYPLHLMALFPNETVEVKCVSTIPSYVAYNHEYADIKQSTIIGLTIELGTHLDLTSFVAGVNNQGKYNIRLNLALISHLCFDWISLLFVEKLLEVYVVQSEPSPTQLPIKIESTSIPASSSPQSLFEHSVVIYLSLLFLVIII